MFEQFIHQLRQRLKGPLPGHDAHIQMAPSISSGTRFFPQDKSPRPGGVLVLLYPENGEIRFPLMLRPDYGGIHSGQISLPGGKKETHDQSLVETALRETEEEIGVPRSDVEVIGTLSELFIIASNFKVLPVVGFLTKAPQFNPDQEEVEQIIETNLDHLLSANTVKSKELMVGNNIKLQAPYFDVEDHVVWGATAMMLSEFVQVVRELR